MTRAYKVGHGPWIECKCDDTTECLACASTKEQTMTASPLPEWPEKPTKDDRGFWHLRIMHSPTLVQGKVTDDYYSAHRDYERARADAAMARLRLAIGHLECVAIHTAGEPIDGELIDRVQRFLKMCGDLPND